MEIFEKASRMKLRFYHKGQCSVEELWDVSLIDLDRLYSRLAANKNTTLNSLLNGKAIDEELELSIKIIKHIVTIRLEEKEIKSKEADRKVRKQKLLSIISKKQDEKYENMDIKELTDLVDNL
jgi:hypothetical protein